MEAVKNPYCFAFYKRPPFGETFFFFNGTLMDPETLAAILGSSKKPHLYKCYIMGYHTMLWGEYPALLGGPRAIESTAWPAKSKPRKRWIG